MCIVLALFFGIFKIIFDIDVVINLIGEDIEFCLFRIDERWLFSDCFLCFNGFFLD